MTEKQLISKLSYLRDVKPSEDWVVLTKRKVLGSLDESAFMVNPSVDRHGWDKMFTNFVSGVLLEKKIIYSFAVFLLVFIGGFGFMQQWQIQPSQEIATNSSAALVEVRGNIEVLKTKSQVLDKIIQTNSQDISLALKDVKEAVKVLAFSIKDNPSLAKEVALEIQNNGTLATIIHEVDNKQSSESLYHAVLMPLIQELNNNQENLSESQKATLKEAHEMYDEGKYSAALELLLTGSNREE
jgi:hypothetical protein